MIRLANSLSCVFLVAILFGCHNQAKSHASATHENELIEQNIALTDSLNANRYDSIYFAGQPVQSDWQKLKDLGFTTIINLRNPAEHDEASQREHLASLGLKYYNVAFPSQTTMDDQYIDAVTKHIVENRKEGKILVHCASGARVGIWLAGHFFKDHGMSKEEALQTAKALGLNRADSIKKAQDYLDSKP